MKSKLVGIMLLLFFCICVSQVQADLITIKITGIVTSSQGSAIPNIIHVGDTFTGIYNYESPAFDLDSSPQRGVYQYNSPYGISISVGGYEFMTAPGHVGQFEMQTVNDDPTNGVHDYYSIFSDENISVPALDLTIGWISWKLSDSSHNALSSDALPVTAPVLTNWNYNYFEIFGFGVLDLWIRGTVAEAILIPEPASGIMILLAGMFFRKRRR